MTWIKVILQFSTWLNYKVSHITPNCAAASARCCRTDMPFTIIRAFQHQSHEDTFKYCLHQRDSRIHQEHIDKPTPSMNRTFIEEHLNIPYIDGGHQNISSHSWWTPEFSPHFWYPQTFPNTADGHSQTFLTKHQNNSCIPDDTADEHSNTSEELIHFCGVKTCRLKKTLLTTPSLRIHSGPFSVLPHTWRLSWFSYYYLHSSMFNSSLWVPLHFLTVEAFQTCVTPSMWCRFDILRLKASHHLNRNELYGNLAAYWRVQKRTFPKWNKMKSCGLPTWAANGVNSRSTLSDEVFVVCAEINRMASGGTAVCSMQ